MLGPIRRAAWVGCVDPRTPSVAAASQQRDDFAVAAITISHRLHHSHFCTSARSMSRAVDDATPSIDCLSTAQSDGVSHAPPPSMDSAESDACVICLEAISERATTVPCGHQTFDFLCIVSWLHEQANCPLCKASVAEVHYDQTSPSSFKRYIVPQALQPPKTTQIPHRGRAPQHNSHNRAPHRRWQQRPRPAFEDDEETALLRRRHVYARKLFSLHVGANRISRFSVITPGIFAAEPELQSRARMWIRRELRVFAFLDPTNTNTNINDGDGVNGDGSGAAAALPQRALCTPSNAEFLLEYIIAILKTVDIKDASGRAEDMLAEFLGRDNARLFLHELGAWLRSPYTNVRDWDRHVQYAEVLSHGGSGKQVGSGDSHAGRRGEDNNTGEGSRRYEPYSRPRHAGQSNTRRWRGYEPD